MSVDVCTLYFLFSNFMQTILCVMPTVSTVTTVVSATLSYFRTHHYQCSAYLLIQKNYPSVMDMGESQFNKHLNKELTGISKGNLEELTISCIKTLWLRWLIVAFFSFHWMCPDSCSLNK